jgi:hypothetical protein
MINLPGVMAFRIFSAICCLITVCINAFLQVIMQQTGEKGSLFLTIHKIYVIRESSFFFDSLLKDS